MKHIGDTGEILAIRYLQKHGFTICDTNFRFGKFWEIDIIASHQGVYHFIEVKYRNHLGFWYPEESIIPQKLRKCYKTLEYYCVRNKIPEHARQFDIIAILKKESSYQVTHYRNIEI